MRNRRVRILHEGHEYYLVDQGRTSSRVITFLKRLESGDEPNGAVLVKTDVGDCIAIANWSAGSYRAEKGHEEILDVFRHVVERYLEEFRVGRSSTKGPTYFFLSVDRKPLFSLSKAQPDGLSVLIFTTRDEARRAAEAREGIDSREIATEEIRDLGDFLAARATEGFAGATLDDRDPIFFCLDEHGAPRFLRLSMDESRGRIEHYLLDLEGGWSRYEGEEELTPEVDQDVVDHQMVDRLGEVPFLGFHDGVPLYRLARKNAPELPLAVELNDDELAEGQPFCPVFHDLELGRSFLEENRLEGLELVPVTDLKALASWCLDEGRVLLVQPDGHRARAATVWLAGDQVVLDSFSGLWYSRDGVHFHRE